MRPVFVQALVDAVLGGLLWHSRVAPTMFFQRRYNDRFGEHSSAGEAMQWKPEYESGYAPMDDVHREFLDCVNVLIACDEVGLQAALDAFSAHAVAHFGEEDRLMAATTYASAGCHVDEHAAVLKSLDEVQQALTNGNRSVVRRFAGELARWFPEHAAAMDHGLARWVVQQRLGGAPVALHRSAPPRRA